MQKRLWEKGFAKPNQSLCKIPLTFPSEYSVISPAMNYYAIHYPCGRAVGSSGNRYGTYYFFHSRAARDAWVERGSDFATQRGYREPVVSRDPELRRELRRLDPAGCLVNVLDGDQELALEREQDEADDRFRLEHPQRQLADFELSFLKGALSYEQYLTHTGYCAV